MITKISVTFGSKAVLDKIIKKYPERHLALFSASNNASGLELVDYSGKDPIFSNPIVFNVVSHTGVDNWNHYIDYVEAVLDAQKRKILDAKVSNFMTDVNYPTGMYSAYYMTSSENPDKRVLLTLWKEQYDCMQWKKDEKDNFITYDKFKDDFTVNYHSAGYVRVTSDN
ncbi:hypothetical protein BGL34_02375 [Fructilactobacillus lindneri]|uniref:Monooxygenase n=2 Tax=Fructilactobacillus lindneri TaxID=53444 RepID=A0A0R2JML0_9LACO|nr:hypothetical protein [Fructilactobacillus lindneri]ANZ57988.1 hypothetical protein AYR60_04210 [Fructilactobacillus lindneri]ANZ59258.1 hypothetical protein AYR59_04210 [Fructilactobacillus lindneri]KRN78385.1 hypothetical protein IV52_GL001324 [Fructilactobacillus lindneri DSM 20690 = JCM 11027]POG98905.1 hypothetical protein BGL31_02965 [Fructilactobacillus lindneri]POH00162.1 hypothetical protein BGL33_06260 [Fructilactobacillus lindneri]